MGYLGFYLYECFDLIPDFDGVRHELNNGIPFAFFREILDFAFNSDGEFFGFIWWVDDIEAHKIKGEYRFVVLNYEGESGWTPSQTIKEKGILFS